MNEAVSPASQLTPDISVESFTDLRTAGFAPREIFRLHQLRDALRCYPHLEFFSNDQWCRLLFLKWRYDNGEYAEDMPFAARPTAQPTAEPTSDVINALEQ